MKRWASSITVLLALHVAIGGTGCPPPGTSVAVPNLVGLSQSAAEAALEEAGLILGPVSEAFSDSVAAGLIISQRPSAGSTVASGTSVSITVSLGLEPAVDDGEGVPPPPVVTAPSLETSENRIRLTGQTIARGAIRVNGGAALAETSADAGGAFALEVALRPNRKNQLFVIVRNARGLESPPAVIQVVQDAEAPSLHIDFPPDGATLTNESITVAGRVSDLLSGFMGLAVEVNGAPAAVAIGIGSNGTFDRPNVPLAPGLNRITAVATDALGNTVERGITVTRVEPVGTRLSTVSGDGQSAMVYNRLPQPLRVRMIQPDGTPFAGKLVTFRVTRSNGLLGPLPNEIDARARAVQVATNADGEAAVYFWMGSDAGCGNNRVEVTSTDISGTTFFCATALPGPPSQINIGSGNYQRGEAGAPLPDPLRVWVNDGCNGIGGTRVTFTVISGGGRVNGQESVTVETSATGHAQVSLELGARGGNNRVTATFAENPGLAATFEAYGQKRNSTLPTTFTGVVIDNASQPIGGVGCTLLVNNTTLFSGVRTDAEGRFHFDGLPPGPAQFFLDGLQATEVGGVAVPPGSFPGLSYNLVIVPNAANSLSTPVKLPPLNPANAVLYDGSRDITLTIAGVEGLEMRIKAGSMTRRDGTRPSLESPQVVSLDQVHHDAVPMPMPDGVAPPFAWTLQPASATFDPPVEVIYPNITGLDPGAIAYFLSYNHDNEQFDIVGSGAVSEDGSVIQSDPGSGLTISGWGGNCPPYAVTGDVNEKCPDEDWGPNGCGSPTVETPVPIPQNVVVPGLLGPGYYVPLHPACDNHDICYATCGKTQTECDLDFLSDLLKQCDQYIPALDIVARNRCAVVAAAYTTAVATFGEEAHRTSQERLQECGKCGKAGGPGVKQDSLESLYEDYDRDLMPDEWELEMGLDPSTPADAFLDPDGDGLPNFYEFLMGTDPLLADTDGDGIDDFQFTIALQPELPDRLDPTWRLSLLGQVVTPDAAGIFRFSNVSAPDEFGPEGPGTPPDFLSDDFARITGISSTVRGNRYVYSPPFRIPQGETVEIDTNALIFSNSPPPVPQSIHLGAASALLEVGVSIPLATIGVLLDGNELDVTTVETGTTYRVSNSGVARVDDQGILTALAPGVVLVTATNSGATAIKRFEVARGLRDARIQGFVRQPDGEPASGARVSCAIGGAITDATGFFEISGATGASVSELTVFVDWEGDAAFGAASRTVALSEAGVSDAGILVLELADPSLLVRWTGGNSGRWDDPANWSSGAAPGPGAIVRLGSPEEPINVTVESFTRWEDMRVLAGQSLVTVTGSGWLQISGETRYEGTLLLQSQARLVVSGGDTVFQLDGDIAPIAGAIPGGQQIYIENGALAEIGRLSGSADHRLALNVSAPGSRVVITGPGDLENSQIAISGILSLPQVGEMTSTSITVSFGGHVDAPILEAAAGAEDRVDLIQVLDGSTFSAPGLRSLVNMGLVATNGGALEFPLLTEFRVNYGCGDVFISANGVRFQDGRRSSISLPALEHIEYSPSFPFCTGFLVFAGSGARVDLPMLSEFTLGSNVTSHHTFRVSGEGSELAVPSLTSLGDTLAFYVETGGVLTSPNVTELLGNVQVLAGSSLALRQVVRARGSAFTVSGALDLPALAELEACTINLAGNGRFSLPEAPGSTDTSITATGNSVLEIPKLAYLASEGVTRTISVSENASIQAPALSSLRNMKLTSNTGGQLTFPALEEFAFDAACADQVISASGVYAADGRPGAVSLPRLEEIVYEAPAYCGGITIWANSGAVVNLPALVAVSRNLETPYDQVFRASGAGSLIDVSSLEVLERGLAFYLESGGTILSPNLTDVAGNLTILSGSEADLPGATRIGGQIVRVGGVLRLPALQRLDNGTVELTATGRIDAPELSEITDTNVSISGSAAFDAPLLQTVSGGPDRTRAITVNGDGVFLAPALVSLVNVRLTANSGGWIELPALTEFFFDAGCGDQIVLSSGVHAADGAPSLVSLPVLEEIAFLVPPYCGGFTIWATAGGVVELPMLAALERTAENPHDHAFRASGAGSLLDLPSLPALGGGFSLYLEHGGTVNAPALSLVQGNISVVAGSEATLPAAETLDGVVLTVSGRLSLPALTTLNRCTVNLSGDAMLELDILASMAHTLLNIGGNAVVDAPNLASAAAAADGNGAISVSGGGAFLAPQLSSLVNMRLSASSGAAIELPALTEFRFDGVCGGHIINAQAAAPNGDPSLIALPALQTLIVLAPPFCAGFTVSAVSGAQVDLSLLSTIILNTENAYNSAFSASGAGSRIDLRALATAPSLVLFQEPNGGVIVRPAKEQARLDTEGPLGTGPVTTRAQDTAQYALAAPPRLSNVRPAHAREAARRD
ncbi:MAG: PASTA domain-containing protein [Candidatus Hydrogenedentes bacterium]|nr:PASTA domain-containing protein [Candidatus Hydrogenedentota bacterium]